MLKIKEFRDKHPIRFNTVMYLIMSMTVFGIIGLIFGRPWYEALIVSVVVTALCSFDAVMKELDKQQEDGKL